jgi:hypothetical protein
MRRDKGSDGERVLDDGHLARRLFTGQPKTDADGPDGSVRAMRGG